MIRSYYQHLYRLKSHLNSYRQQVENLIYLFGREIF